MGEAAVTGSAESLGDPARPRADCRRERRRLVERRAATWRWQRRLELRRFRTHHPERWVRGCAYLRWLKALWAQRADQAWRTWARLQGDVAFAIRWVFQTRWREAYAVAWCESKLGRRARNGQYEGVFQMGAWARATYGHGPTAFEQARAAHRYFVDSGRDWSPWSCRP